MQAEFTLLFDGAQAIPHIWPAPTLRLPSPMGGFATCEFSDRRLQRMRSISLSEIRRRFAPPSIGMGPFVPESAKLNHLVALLRPQRCGVSYACWYIGFWARLRRSRALSTNPSSTMPQEPAMSAGTMLRISAGIVRMSGTPVCQNTHSPPSCDAMDLLPVARTMIASPVLALVRTVALMAGSMTPS